MSIAMALPADGKVVGCENDDKFPLLGKPIWEEVSLACCNSGIGAYVGLPLGVVGSPGGKWLCVVWGRRSPPSWHPLMAGGFASEQARLVKTVKVQ